MNSMFRKAALGLALTASVAVTAAPAEARDRYYRHHRGDNDAALAIGAGIVGLAIGAAIASDRRDRYYDDRYYDGPYYRDGYYRDRGYHYGPRGYYRRGYAYPAYPRYRYDRYRNDRYYYRR